MSWANASVSLVAYSLVMMYDTLLNRSAWRVNELFLLSLISFTLLGLFIGSFLNVCIDRLPQGLSIISPPSHCSVCNNKLAAMDLIPVFSYLWLRGRCRYCRVLLPIRLPIVEGVTGFLFVFLYWKFGLGLELAISLVYTCLAVIIFIVDLENQLVLDKVVYPGMVIALAFSFFSDLRVVIALVGGVIGLAAMGLPYIIYRRGMGLGDVKLGALVGLMTGYPLVVVAWLLAVISGGLVAGILLAFRIKKRREPIPFAPFLATSAIVTLLWGQAIYKWYLG
ncbi:prepilin peptidase [Chloroflexota bacterium]